MDRNEPERRSAGSRSRTSNAAAALCSRECSRTGLPIQRASPLPDTSESTPRREPFRSDTPEREVKPVLRTEPSLAQRVGPDRAQEVDPAEVGPVGLTEVELRLRALPQQEATEPLLSRGADHQIGVRLALRVDVLDVDHGRQVLE